MRVEARRHRDVREDIVGIANYLVGKSVDAAVRFPGAVESAIHGLRDFPGKGSLKDFGQSASVDIRSYAVDGFRNHLIVYRRDPDGGSRS